MRSKFSDSQLIGLYKALIWLTLFGAALHFSDNVRFFPKYPEPSWLSAQIVAILFVPLALIALLAWMQASNGRIDRSIPFAYAFAAANVVSLGHYLIASPFDIDWRINALIALQVGLGMALLVTTLVVQLRLRFEVQR